MHRVRCIVGEVTSSALVTAGLLACWALVGAVWAAGAILAWRRGPAVREKTGRDVSPLAGVAAGLVILGTPDALWRPFTASWWWLRAPGFVILLAATAATVWSRAALGSLWSSGSVVKEQHVLRTGGPYRLTRHAIYTGILGMLAGSALIEGLGRWAALAIAIGLMLLLKIRVEERLLAREFPEDHERYRREVPLVIPGLRPRGSRR
jgi:protein-S-isoprenylcysteine O-methyltransferase Ste14